MRKTQGVAAIPHIARLCVPARLILVVLSHAQL